MSKLSPLPNPNIYKRFASNVVEEGNQSTIRSTLGELNEIRGDEDEVVKAYGYDDLTRENRDIAQGASIALKPDIDAIADARSRRKAASKGQSEEDIASLNLLERGAQIDLAINTPHAVEAARMLGHLASREQ